MDNLSDTAVKMVNGTSADVDRSALHQQNSTTDSLGGDTSIDEYKKRLRRRRKKASDGCWDLTCYSWFFLLVALLQGMPLSTVASASESTS